jgi:Spy/CpxP family protein refolding chaperone
VEREGLNGETFEAHNRSLGMHSVNTYLQTSVKNKKGLTTMSRAIHRMTVGLILCLGIAMLSSPATQAQPQRMSIEDRVKILNDSLKLSKEQSSKITKILEDQREEMTTAMGQNQGDREAMQSARQEIMKKANDQIKAVLTEEQAAKYDQMIKSRRARMGQRTQKSGE